MTREQWFKFSEERKAQQDAERVKEHVIDDEYKYKIDFNVCGDQINAISDETTPINETAPDLETGKRRASVDVELKTQNSMHDTLQKESSNSSCFGAAGGAGGVGGQRLSNPQAVPRMKPDEVINPGQLPYFVPIPPPTPEEVKQVMHPDDLPTGPASDAPVENKTNNTQE